METPNVPPSVPATPNANAAPEGAAKPVEVQKFKLKDTEYTETELLSHIEKGKGADKKFQEAAAQKREVEKVIAALKNSPAKVVLNKAFGHNPTEFLKQYIKEALDGGADLKQIKETLSEQMFQWIQDENLDPKEREIRELKKQLEKNEALKKAEADQKQQELVKQYTEKAYQDFSTQIVDALKDSGLPKTAFTVKRFAYWLDQAYKLKADYEKNGLQVRKPTAKDVVEYVRKDYDDSFKELYGSADVETLIRLIGEDNVRKLREHDITKFRQGGVAPTAKPIAPSALAGGKEPKGRNFLKAREEEIRRMEQEER